jgi:hypothetical protein
MAYDVEIDGIYYYLYNNDKTAEVANGTDKYSGEVVIPSSITQGSIEYEVTSIGNYAFNQCTELTSVVIPETVTELGERAFYDCKGLTSITIPKNVTSIYSYTFRGCENLKTINYNAKDCILKGATSGSFFQFISKQITSITFGSDVEVIPSSMCSGMSKLTSVVIPENVKIIEDKAFYNCTGLTSLSLHDNLAFIGRYVFTGTFVENSTNWEDGLLYYNNYLIDSDRDVVTGDLKIKEGTKLIASDVFSYRTNITSVILPEGLKYINSSAFYGCGSLSSITLPSTIVSIDEMAFMACNALKKVNFLGSVDNWVDINFYDQNSNPISNSHNLYINDELLTKAKTIEADSIKQFVFNGCNSLVSVEIGPKVGFVSPESFFGCYNLTDIVWGAKNASYPKAYNYYQSSPFYQIREMIKTFTFTDDVEYIPTALCYEMSQIEEITIPKNVKQVSYYAFQYCSKLGKVTWNAKSCEDFSYTSYMIMFPFYNCYNINEIIIGEDVQHIPACCFYGAENASSVTIASGLKSVGDDAFYNCKGLNKVNYLGSVDEWVGIEFEGKYSNPIFYSGDFYIKNEMLTNAKIVSAAEVKDYAFNKCKSISMVEIGLNVDDIAQNSFRDCENLTAVKWNARYCDDFASDNYSPFTYGTKVSSFEFGEEVKYIPAYLCVRLDSLKTLVIPESVTAIGGDAFVGTENLESVYAYPEVVPTMKTSPFSSYNATLYVPCKSLPDYSSNDYFRNFKEIKCVDPVDIVETEASLISIQDGTISCEGSEFDIYNISGLDVTAQNGSLTPGIYLVSTSYETVKVMVK